MINNILKVIACFSISAAFACSNLDRLDDLSARSDRPPSQLKIDQNAHLVLNFDLNGTLLGFDSAKGMEVDHYLRRMMTHEIVGAWDESGTISYNDWVYKQFPDDKDGRERALMRLTEVIKDQEYYQLFERVVDKLQDQLKQRQVVQSFYSLIERLDQMGVSYTVNIRTFGDDIQEVAEEIEEFSSLKFDELIEVKGDTWVLSDGTEVTSVAEQAKLLREKNCLVHDDYSYWQKNDRRLGFGKLFPQSNMESVYEFFFDDNVMEDDSGLRSIVAPRSLSGSLCDVQNYLGDTLIHVNTAEAILDSNYYIDLVGSHFLLELKDQHEQKS